jgi:uridine kinase
MAYELLLQIPSSAPQYLAARRLCKMLHYFLPAGGAVMEEIPPLSILREFVGDSAFYDIH